MDLHSILILRFSPLPDYRVFTYRIARTTANPIRDARNIRLAHSSYEHMLKTYGATDHPSDIELSCLRHDGRLMQTSIECIPCFVRQAEEAVALSTKNSVLREKILRLVLHALADADWAGSPPAIAQRLHHIIRKETGEPDPYREVKDRMNGLAMEALPCCTKSIAKAADPQEAAVRVAVAGNLLDSGAKIQIQPENLPHLLATLWERPLAGDPHELFLAAEKAERILYLADNAGEIVFDRLLLNFLPMEKVTLAVRGSPVLNDALREDAALAGFTGLVPVIDNGSDAPGTVLEDCSEEFRRHFDKADLVISKGQGNYETLSAVRAPIFFLFTVKCPIVAAQIGEPTGTMIVKKSALWTESCRRAQL